MICKDCGGDCDKVLAELMLALGYNPVNVVRVDEIEKELSKHVEPDKPPVFDFSGTDYYHFLNDKPEGEAPDEWNGDEDLL